MRILVDDLAGPEIAAFLQEHVEEMRAVTPLESKHALDLEGLRHPDVTFWTVHDGGALVACGAIKALDAHHGEIKSMRTVRERKGTGIASLLLQHIISESRRVGLSRLSLETGPDDFFAPARRLYLRHGFRYTGPFADYVDDPNSVFMTRAL